MTDLQISSRTFQEDFDIIQEHVEPILFLFPPLPLTFESSLYAMKLRYSPLFTLPRNNINNL